LSYLRLTTEYGHGYSRTAGTVISTKGQVILLKALRDPLHWTPGTKLTVENTPDAVLLKASPNLAPSTIEEGYGFLRYDGPANSLEEMDAAIVREARRRARD